MDRISTVWMVHARTGLDGRKGTIALRDGSLLFDPESKVNAESRFALSDIRRVRRVRGSPVLEISVQTDGQPPLIGFYFIRPPSLDEGPDTRYLRRRRARKDALNKLRLANSKKKAEVQRWADAIRGAMESAGTGPVS